jgi:hypothetical protein
MDPYLTPASRVRSDAIFHENLAIRAADIGDDYRKVGNLRQATLSYARASQYAEHAAELRHTAASLPGGDVLDVDIARCLIADSEAYDALANDCDTLWNPAHE